MQVTMSNAITIAAIGVIGLIWQTQAPRYRLLVMLGASAIIAGFGAVSQSVQFVEVYRKIPWGVLLFLGALDVFAKIISSTKIFDLLALKALRFSQARGSLALMLFCALMFVVSCFVNNLTAMLLILPVIFETLRSLRTSSRYALLLLGLLLPMCNLGGAATPIGDFPAILLLSTGRIEFFPYLKTALPICLVLAAFVIVIAMTLNRKAVRNTQLGEVERTVVLGFVEARYEGLRVNWSILGLGVSCLLAMFVLWSMNVVLPEIVAMIGVSICATFFMISLQLRDATFRRRSIFSQKLQLRKEAAASREPDRLAPLIEAPSLVFFFCVFFIVACVEESGVLSLISSLLESRIQDPAVFALALVCVSALISAFFSAGPGMALAIPLADALLARSKVIDAHDLFVGIALGICAGSCLFLTAATSGPIIVRELEIAGLKGRDIHKAMNLNMRSYMGVGAGSFTLILAGALVYTWLSMQ